MLEGEYDVYQLSLHYVGDSGFHSVVHILRHTSFYVKYCYLPFLSGIPVSVASITVYRHVFVLVLLSHGYAMAGQSTKIMHESTPCYCDQCRLAFQLPLNGNVTDNAALVLPLQ